MTYMDCKTYANKNNDASINRRKQSILNISNENQ